jgi:outer membrane protein assembly factor BamB
MRGDMGSMLYGEERSERWKIAVKDGVLSSACVAGGANILSSPCPAAGVVYIGSDDGFVYAIR